MSLLALLLLVKIIVSIVMIIVPFLFFPKEKLEKLTKIQAQSATLFRLYGAAILALVIAYSSGVWEIAQGAFPWGIALMGLVSNTGAVTAIIATGAAANSRFLTAFFSFIAIGCALSLLFPERAIAALI